ncbi:unnamed protein product [Acanthoscelides obtectus]|uniref:Uncharacterized protein n=1 Tax=Acanthoscelides obtectus TaxID=200917 RepID=A0A9P0PLB0_ACAOB|nr:unnamed protein product [Acanthoscelides obtectus]CAK1671532.1 Ejaculatory bulb-specific protein 3 [Acanthoscelides obtectus]
MKLAICLAVLAVCVTVYARPDEKYTTKYDNIDLDSILKNDRLLRNYVDCLLGKRKCTNDGEELKKSLPDAIETDCSKCSAKQKDGAKQVIHYLIDHKRDWWTELEKVYDPEGSYIKKYQAEIKKEGLKL